MSQHSMSSSSCLHTHIRSKIHEHYIMRKKTLCGSREAGVYGRTECSGCGECVGTDCSFSEVMLKQTLAHGQSSCTNIVVFLS